MINNVVLVGRLTKDVELRYTPNGKANARFILAVNRSFTNQQGEREADFIQCQTWGKQAENLANFMKKGSLIGLQGRIQTGSYENQEGKRVFTTDIMADSIQFLESKNSSGGQQQSSNAGYQQQPPANTGYQQQTAQQPVQQQPMQQGNVFNQPQNHFQQQPAQRVVQHDPFANSKGPIEVSESDLPF